MLLDYIPSFLSDISEFKKLFSALDIEVSKLNIILEDIFDSGFVYYCSLPYIERFEKIMGIVDFGNMSEKERRDRIILKLNEKLPYTVFRFKESLDFICGNENYFLLIVFDEYRIVLRIKNDKKAVINEVLSLIDRMIPANMAVSVHKFNTHEIVGRFRHDTLSLYTHNEIYSSIIRGIIR